MEFALEEIRFENPMNLFASVSLFIKWGWWYWWCLFHRVAVNESGGDGVLLPLPELYKIKTKDFSEEAMYSHSWGTQAGRGGGSEVLKFYCKTRMLSWPWGRREADCSEKPQFCDTLELSEGVTGTEDLQVSCVSVCLSVEAEDTRHWRI